MPGPSDFRGLAAQVVEKLYVIFKLDRVGLFDWPDNERPRLIKGLAKHEVATGSTERVETLELGAKQCALLEEARKKGRALENRRSTGGAQILAFAVPLIVGDECLASLYLDGRVDSITLETSDLVFIRALAAQLDVALDRARLIEQEQRRQEREKQQLRSELEELRQALQQAKLVYRSEQMEAVLATARRVAPTGATVLITGESGTGKELIARTLHQLSPRRKKPLVVVDCSSIPRDPHRKRAVWSREGRFHRRPPAKGGAPSGRGRGNGAPRRDRRAASRAPEQTAPLRPGKAVYARGGGRGPTPSTFT